MARNHTLSISLTKIIGGNGRIVLRYRGIKKFERSLHRDFPIKHWDNIRYNIKQSHQNKYTELAKLIEEYKGCFPRIIDQLNKGALHPSNALDAVMGKAMDKGHALTLPD